MLLVRQAIQAVEKWRLPTAVQATGVEEQYIGLMILLLLQLVQHSNERCVCVRARSTTSNRRVSRWHTTHAW
jgi:hypothetical protein